MTVPYVVHKTFINKEDTDMVIPSEKQVEHFESKNKDFPVPIDKDDKKELLEIALYSMITYLAASRTLDFIVEGIEEYIGVTIVAVHNEDIRQMIINDMGRGVTIYMGKRVFGKEGESKEVEIIYTVITRLELNKLTTEIEKIEPNAFVVMNSVKDTKGGIVKKRPLQH
jgi:uncharacterized membrane-anchored protein YitT (DUF2179 family)